MDESDQPEFDVVVHSNCASTVQDSSAMPHAAGSKGLSALAKTLSGLSPTLPFLTRDCQARHGW